MGRPSVRGREAREHHVRSSDAYRVSGMHLGIHAVNATSELNRRYASADAYRDAYRLVGAWWTLQSRRVSQAVEFPIGLYRAVTPQIVLSG